MVFVRGCHDACMLLRPLGLHAPRPSPDSVGQHTPNAPPAHTARFHLLRIVSFSPEAAMRQHTGILAGWLPASSQAR